MNEKIIRIDLIKNLQEILLRIEGISQDLFALDDELSQGVAIDRQDLFYPTMHLAEDVEKAKHIVYKLKAIQRRTGGDTNGQDREAGQIAAQVPPGRDNRAELD